MIVSLNVAGALTKICVPKFLILLLVTTCHDAITSVSPSFPLPIALIHNAGLHTQFRPGSTLQLALHQSQSVLSQSSHISPVSLTQFPHRASLFALHVAFDHHWIHTHCRCRLS